ncbi:MAG: Rpn family recombination-promoting nuclease/putative transposase [Holosporaceae bacterium]|nr:Rpn family recombination-promoting nuclease/putative transposase [Holosporaceae bacterium]
MTKSKEITATNDVMFKIILGAPKHTRLLIHFLNSAIKSETPIESVEIINTELTPEYIGQKGSRLDIKAKTRSGELINVEMQCGTEKHMVARVLFYWSKMFAGQIEVSDEYYKLKRTVSISILDFRLFDDDRYWRKNHITDDETKEKTTELLEMQFIELNKMRQVDKESPITFWIEFFRNPYSESVRALCDYVPEIREAKDIFEKAKSDPKARELIETREKALHDYANDIANARNESKAEGIIEGELKKAGALALKMLKKGASIEDIADLTELPVEQIKSLRDKQ